MDRVKWHEFYHNIYTRDLLNNHNKILKGLNRTTVSLTKKEIA